MTTTNTLLKALERESTELKSADMLLNGKVHKVFYRLMSVADHSRAIELSKKTKTVKEVDGSEATLTYIDDDLVMAHIIYFQLLDKEGKRVFTDLSKVSWIQKNITYETSAYLASVMGLRAISDIVQEQVEVLKKMTG